MPANAAELYNEAQAVMPVSRRASAALARAALERLLRDLDESNSNARLDELVAGLSGKITQPLWQLLTALRVIGNTALHGGEEESEIVALYLEGDAADVVEPFFGAMNSLVEERITQPRKAQALYEMIPAPKREDAERKAAKAESGSTS